MKLTRQEVIKQLVEKRLDTIDGYTSFEQACEDMIIHGVSGLNSLSNKELEDEYYNEIGEEDNIEVVE